MTSKLYFILPLLLCLSLVACEKKDPTFVAKDEKVHGTSLHFDDEIPTEQQHRAYERKKISASRKQNVKVYQPRKNKIVRPY